MDNAQKIKSCADNCGVKLYFMLKQIGGNPYIASKLMSLGYEGAVAVDFKEAQFYLDNKIKLGHAGHLVQIPNCLLEKILLAQPQVVTVYSEEKILQINKICKKFNLKQGILLKVSDEGDILYRGQEAGFSLAEIVSIAQKYKDLKNAEIIGITSFPSMLYDGNKQSIEPTHNFETLLKASIILEKCGCKIKQINAPSASCCRSIPKLAELGANYAEPGHAFTGTTPLHAVCDEPETPCIIYLSEISHNFKGNSFCYGGGHYRRSNMKNAFVGYADSYQEMEVCEPDSQSIDYHFELKGESKEGACVIMSFRTQIFTARSDVVLIENLHRAGSPKIAGIFDSRGKSIFGT
jgi:predicted amino acid racemase